jgi:hypothetical protein
LIVVALTVMCCGGVVLGQSANEQNMQNELEKLKRENKELIEEQYASWLTMGTIAVTALIGFGTIAYNVRNAKYQAQLQARLKALEVVVSAAGPKTAAERLKIIKELLGEEFLDPSLGDSMIAHGVGQGHDQNRKDLMEMLLEYPDRRGEVFALWRVAFGGTNLRDNLDKMESELKRLAPSPRP